MVYGIRIVLLCLLVVFVLPFGLIAGLISPRNPRWNAIFIRPYSRLALPILGIKFTLSGAEHLDLKEPAIIVANHQHRFDIALLMYLLPKRCVILAKSAVMWIPVTGWLFWLWGNIAVRRKDKKNRHAAMKSLAEVLKRRRASLWIFPEGSRYQGTSLNSFKDGAFELAYENNRPIVAIVASPYAHQVKVSAWRSAFINITVLPPIHPKNFADAESLKISCHEKMNILFETYQASDGV